MAFDDIMDEAAELEALAGLRGDRDEADDLPLAEELEEDVAAEDEVAEPMDEEEVHGRIKRLVDIAKNWREEHLEPEMVKATDYYQAKPYGDEVEGRSQVVTTEVRDTVLAMIPSLLRIMWGPEMVVEFEPEGPEDVELAKQQTETTDYVIRKRNRGFQLMHAVLKDALVRKLGFAKWFWEEKTKVEGSYQTGMSLEQIYQLEEDESVEDYEVVAQYISPTVPPQPLFDCNVRRVTDSGQVRVMAVPPEEVGWDPDARDLDECRMFFHIREVSPGEAIAEGWPEELVEEHTGKVAEKHDGQLRASRRIDNQDHEDRTELDTVQIGEVYLRVDEDGDGIDELRVYDVIGGQYEILPYSDEELGMLCDEIPFSVFCPDPEPHTIVGQSIADRTMDIQRISSAVLRGMLDSLAMSLNPGHEIVEGAVNLGDVMNQEIGRVVRVTRPQMMRDIVTPFVGKEAFPMLQYMQEMRENRTGQSKASIGLDADALQSTTASAVAAQMQAGQQHIEMIARVLAEGGFTRMFRGVARLLAKHQDRAMLIRLRGEDFVEVDPRAWNMDMDVTVAFPLGAGSTQEKIQRLLVILQEQKAQLETGSPLVTPVEVRHTLGKLAELMGEANPDAFWVPFGPQELQQMQQMAAQNPPPPPAEIIAIEAQKEIEAAKLQYDLEKLFLEDDRERDKAALDAEVKIATAELQYQGQLDREEIKARAQRHRQTNQGD